MKLGRQSSCLVRFLPDRMERWFPLSSFCRNDFFFSFLPRRAGWLCRALEWRGLGLSLRLANLRGWLGEAGGKGVEQRVMEIGARRD